MKATKTELASLEVMAARSDFVRANNQARKWVSQSLVLQVVAHDRDVKRVGYTVTKRVHKSAVKRNRIKRRLRAVAAEVLPSCAMSGHDYVLIGRLETADRPYDVLVKDLKWCLKRLDMRYDLKDS